MAKAKRSPAQRAATKRMLAAAAERRASMGRTSGAKKRRPKKSGRKALVKRGTTAAVSHTTHGLKLKKAPKGASDAVRLSALEHNQQVIVRCLSTVAEEVVQHRHALIAGGLLAARGRRKG